MVFLRDEDGDSERVRGIERGLEDARRSEPTEQLRLVGGIPTRSLESWILALCGVRGTEAMGRERLREELERHGFDYGRKNTAHYVDVVRHANLDRLPDDATRLHEWLAELRAALAAAGPGGG